MGKLLTSGLDWLEFRPGVLGKRVKLIALDSAAGDGGSASESMTFAGLKADDTILAVHQVTAGANDLAITEWSSQADDTLTVAWTGDPGAGAVVRVVVARGF